MLQSDTICVLFLFYLLINMLVNTIPISMKKAYIF
jgi:hypothetical protein